MEQEEITLRKLLDRILDDLSYKHRDVVVNPIPSDGANYTTGLYKVAVTSPGKEDLHLFCKVANVGDALRKMISIEELFAQERLIYEDLQKLYNSLQTKYSISEKERFVFAKYYGSDLTPGSEAFVFEDLTKKGFRVYDRLNVLNWDHMSENIRVLAKFHALSMALEKENLEFFTKITKRSHFADGIEEFLKAIPDIALEGLSESYKTKLRDFIIHARSSDLVLDNFKPYGKDVIIHSDFKPSNIMYKRQGKDITVIPIDFQTVRVGCVMSDIVWFLLTATDGEFRRLHFERLMDLYHSQLSLWLEKMEINVNDVYPREQFDKELKKMLPTMLALGLVMYPVLLTSPENAPDVKDAEIANFVVRPNALCTTRLAELVDDFIRWKLI